MMDWQFLLVIVLLTLALIYLGRQTLRTWSGKGGGCGGCKHHTAASRPNNEAQTLIPQEQVRLRRTR